MLRNLQFQRLRKMTGTFRTRIFTILGLTPRGELEMCRDEPGRQNTCWTSTTLHWWMEAEEWGNQSVKRCILHGNLFRPGVFGEDGQGHVRIAYSCSTEVPSLRLKSRNRFLLPLWLVSEVSLYMKAQTICRLLQLQKKRSLHQEFEVPPLGLSLTPSVLTPPVSPADDRNVAVELSGSIMPLTA